MPKNGNGVFVIDGVSLRLWVTSLERSFSVLDSEHSGRVQSALMHRDIKGTFYNYTLGIDADRSNPVDYDTFYQIVSSPTPSHNMIFPYAQSTLEFDAYVTSGKDKLKIEENGNDQYNRWSGLSIEFIAMEPQRRP